MIYYDYDCPSGLSDDERNIRKPSKADEKLIRLLPDNYLENYKMEAEGKTDEEKLYYRILLVNDFISGMTDSYAKSLYQELTGIY